MGLFRSFLRLLFPPSKKKRVVWLDPTPVSEKLARRARANARPGPEIRIVRETVFVGRCWVIDGDTIDIKGTRIRLAGIDAPELEDPYGKLARGALIRLCHGAEVRAVTEGNQSYGRLVATCYLPDGRDLSAELVKAGLALDWPAYLYGKYRTLELENIRRKLWRCDARQRGKAPAVLPD